MSKTLTIILGKDEEFPIGGSKVVRQSKDDVVTVAAAGVTLNEALSAYEELKKRSYDDQEKRGGGFYVHPVRDRSFRLRGVFRLDEKRKRFRAIYRNTFN